MATGTEKRNQISQERFVTMWVKAHKEGWTMQQLAKELGISYNAVTTRAKSYQKKGINLPSIKTGQRGKSINTDNLNSLLDRLLKGEEISTDEVTDEQSDN